VVHGVQVQLAGDGLAEREQRRYPDQEREDGQRGGLRQHSVLDLCRALAAFVERGTL
jgi:hypothetical protein